MTNPSLLTRLQRAIGMRKPEEIEEELRRDPIVQRADRAVRLGERTIAELDVLERRKAKNR